MTSDVFYYLTPFTSIAKVQVNWLTVVVDRLVEPFQSVFIPRRQLMDVAVTVREITVAW